VATKSKVSLTFYGGVGEVGGNKILLSDGDSKIMLDFGMSFSQMAQYFSDFSQPRALAGMNDLFITGILPDIPGLYRQDFLQQMGRKPEREPLVDAVLLTHAHADHCADVQYLRADIPLACSKETKAVMRAIDETGIGGELCCIKEKFRLEQGKNGTGKMTRAHGEATRIEREMLTKDKLKFGNLAIEAVPVDHSIPGSRAYIIHTREGTVVYTGDLRFHGWNGKKTEEFARIAAKEKPIALICEGTRIDQSSCTSEKEVLKRIGEIMGRTRGLVVANYPPRDTDRMRTFLEAARKNERKLAINFKQAYMLDAMREELGCSIRDCPATDDEDILIFAEKKRWGLVGRKDVPKEQVEQDYSPWEREYLERDNAVTIEEIGKNQSKSVLYCGFPDLPNLTDIKLAGGSRFIRSVCEPFSDEMLLDETRVTNWLKLLGLYPGEQAHASGHACGPEIKQLIKTIKPKKVIPVHTEKPELFAKLVKGVPAEMPVRGREMTV